MEGSDSIPAIRSLLIDIVDSIEKLEVLLRLVQSSPAKPLQIAGDRGIPEPLVLEASGPLVEAGLLRVDRGLYSYVPENKHARAVAALSKLYEEDRIVVLRLIAQIAIERVRSAAATVFAEAFVIRKKREDADG